MNFNVNETYLTSLEEIYMKVNKGYFFGKNINLDIEIHHLETQFIIALLINNGISSINSKTEEFRTGWGYKG